MSNGEYQRQSDIAIAEISTHIKGIKEDINEIKCNHREMWNKINKHDTAIEIAKVKSSIYGSISGAIGGFISGLLK